MSLNKVLVVAGVASLVGAMAFGCSSSTTINPGTDDGGSSGSSGPADARPDKQAGDTGTSSSSGGPDGSALCAYADPTAATPPFAATWKPPAAHKDACTQQNIDDYRKFCLGVQTDQGAACKSFLQTANGKTCAQCIDTPGTAASLGPLINQGTYVELNNAGCLALAQGDVTANGCGAKVLAVSQCDSAACASCKVDDTQASLDALNACQGEAETKACKSYADAAKCADTVIEAGAAGSTCFGFKSFDEGYAAMVPIFCLKSGDGGGGG